MLLWKNVAMMLSVCAMGSVWWVELASIMPLLNRLANPLNLKTI